VEQVANVPQMNFASLKKYMWPSLIDTDQDSGEDNDNENNVNATADVIVQDTELDPVKSIVMVFKQLDLNVNSRALAKLLTNNPEQPDIVRQADQNSTTRYNIGEGLRGVWESIWYVTCNFTSHN